MNEECAMQMRAIHKKGENMAATSASRLHWHCSNLPSPTPAHQERVLGGGSERENAAWHFSSYFMLNRPGLWTCIKVLSKEVWLEECTLFKGMHPGNSRNSLNSFQSSKDKQNLNCKKTEANILHEIKSSLNRKPSAHQYFSKQLLRESKPLSKAEYVAWKA